MKIYTDKNGKVHSSGSGSIEKQQAELVAIMAYINRRVAYAKRLEDAATDEDSGKSKPNRKRESAGMTD